MQDVDVGRPVDIFEVGVGIFTRKTDPFAKERVEEVLRQVKLGDDLSAAERVEVRALVAEFADCGRGEVLNKGPTTTIDASAEEVLACED